MLLRPTPLGVGVICDPLLFVAYVKHTTSESPVPSQDCELLGIVSVIKFNNNVPILSQDCFMM